MRLVFSAAMIGVLSLAAFWAVAAGQQPQLAVLGNGIPIAFGDTTPEVNDGTDFGTTTAGQPVRRLFILRNTGTSPLVIDGVSVPTGFEVSEPGQPQFVTPKTIPALGLAVMVVDCEAAVAGTYEDFISVSWTEAGATDPLRGAFTVRCVVEPEPDIDVTGNGIPIVDGDTSPDVADGTNFGVTAPGLPVSRPYLITNRGQGTLTLGGVSVPAGFSLTVQPAAALKQGESSVFEVRCLAAEAGTFTGDISIPSNDPDENPFTFRVSCRVESEQDSAFNPGPGDLPTPPVTRPTSVVTIPAGGGAGLPGSAPVGGQPASGGTATLATPSATPTRVATPTAISIGSGPGEAIFRPPATGRGDELSHPDSALDPVAAVAFVLGLCAVAMLAWRFRRSRV